MRSFRGIPYCDFALHSIRLCMTSRSLPRQSPNQALELTAARIMFAFSMTTSVLPHVTLAPWIPFQAPGFPSAIRGRSRTVFTKTESPASLDALGLLGTSRRRVRSLRTVPAVLSSDEGGRSSAYSR
jgi:hypothetical protein